MQNTEIRHRISTSLGQSGSPIIRKDGNGELSIVGIHKGGKSSYNSGKLLTPKVLEILQAATKIMGAIPFSCKEPI